MFKDTVCVKIKAGNGGNGLVSFGKGRYPNGGNGGMGGNLLFVGDENLYDLSKFTKDAVFRAEDGEIGGTNNRTGRNGKDLYITVPLATNIYVNEKKIASIKTNKQSKLILEGGIGGRGSLSFKSEGADSYYKSTPGSFGGEADITLELELQSDIIFIGLPNAGKSSILNELTNANAKVAPFAFTTLIPQLGRMDNITLMDLPGLIEKTFEGRGLGTRFVKHTRSAKLVAHFISLENESCLDSYNLIREELKLIDEELANKPEIIVLTKTDLVSKEKIESSLRDFKLLGKTVLAVSVYDLDSLEKLKELFKERLQLNP